MIDLDGDRAVLQADLPDLSPDATDRIVLPRLSEVTGLRNHGSRSPVRVQPPPADDVRTTRPNMRPDS